ncbi:MAG TPA: hypothetical protein VG406_00590 [Isosphaeraceae bacterium]|jgi:hypothetical protein|nr:hypothetical protein [Isosphaeraceae bacterium]
MAKSKKSAPVVVVPADAVPAAPTATPAPAPAENTTAPAPIPVKAIPPAVAIAPKREAVAPPAVGLSPKASALTLEFCATVGVVLNAVVLRCAEWGRMVGAILDAERGEANEWGRNQFDATIRKVGEAYAARYPDSVGDARPADWWKLAEFLAWTTKLGIVGAESMAYRTIVNVLFPAAFEMVKDQNASVIRDGWADWLKAIVPMIVNGDVNHETAVASVAAQRTALHALDAKKYPMPKATGAKARKVTKGSGRKNPKATPPAPTPAPTPAPVANRTTPPAPTPTPVPAPAPTPSQQAGAAALNIESFAKGLDAKAALALGVALAGVAKDDAILSIYKAIAPRVKAIRDSKAAPIAVGA